MSVCSVFFSNLYRAHGVTHQGAACDAASVHFGPDSKQDRRTCCTVSFVASTNREGCGELFMMKVRTGPPLNFVV